METSFICKGLLMDPATKRLIEKIRLNSHWPLVANDTFILYDPKLVDQVTQTGRDIVNAITLESDSQPNH